MQIPVDPDALHALMRLVLRLTRDYSLAKFFSEKGGVTALLELEQDSNFIGFSSLAILILRHIMEDPTTLRNAIERVSFIKALKLLFKLLILPSLFDCFSRHQ